MLQSPYTVADAVKRGASLPDEPEGAEVLLFDETYAFVRMRVHGGIASEVIAGPFAPDEEPIPDPHGIGDLFRFLDRFPAPDLNADAREQAIYKDVFNPAESDLDYFLRRNRELGL